VNSHIRSLAFGPADQLYAGTFGQVYRTIDRGGTWEALSEGLGDAWVISLACAGRVVYAGLDAEGLYRSTDDGATWLPTFPTQTPWSIVAVPGEAFVGTTQGIFRSLDDGLSWHPLPVPAESHRAVARGSTGLLYSGTEAGGFFHSSDNGETWSRLATLPSAVHSLAVLPGGAILAGTGSDGILRSNDGGTVWLPAGNGIPDVDIPSIDFDNAGRLFAGTTSGVFTSIDGGTSWTPLNEQLFTFVTRLLVAPDQYAYAATWGRGVFRTSGPTNGIDAELQPAFADFHIDPNYPNPFNSATTIGFVLPGVSVRPVVIGVYDLLGREVGEILRADLPGGAHTVRFEAGGLRSGCYITAIRAGGVQKRLKILLIR